MVHRSALAVAAALLLTACGQSAEAPPPARPSWSLESHGVGMKLALGQHGVHLTLMCHDAPPLMELRVRNFEPVGSEERMSFGAGAEPYVFVAQLDEEGLGVTGERDISDDFLNALSAETQWRVNYGSQDTGLLDAPPAEATQSFVAACRAIVAG